MWVADAEVDKFLAAGHKLAAELCAKPAEVKVEEAPAEVVEETRPKKVSLKRPSKAKKK
jgi:hypothetical protein